jgi:hypothetical protein
MASRGRTTARAGTSASRSPSTSSSKSSTSTSSGSSSASTSSSGTSSSGAGAARSSRSSSSVSVSSPSGSKTVTTTKTTTPTETTKETTGTPQTPITVSADLARAISESQQAYPDAWQEATGTSSAQKQFEQVTGTTIPVITVEESEEPIIQVPELIPQVMAQEEKLILSDDIIQILNDIESGVILVPEWFKNNIEWVKNGHQTQQEFRTAYNYLVEQQIAHSPTTETPVINDSITSNMVTQQVINFNIINGRAIGSIKFIATNNFNPYYYGKNIINIIQFKDVNGANILTTIKQNTLNFTETERDEVINYDEDMKGNTKAIVESFVWEWIDKPTGAFSNKYTIQISQTQPAKPIDSGGIFGAGIGISAIALSIVAGFIIDHGGKK